jgi:hypothetical protein
MTHIVAFGLSTAFGPGAAAIWDARAAEREALTRRADLMGGDFTPQLCSFAPDVAMAGLTDRVLALVSQALADLSSQLAAQGFGWPSNTALVLLTPGPDIGVSPDTAVALANRVGGDLCQAKWCNPQNPMVSIQGGAGMTARALAHAVDLTSRGFAVLLITADSHACRIRLNALLDANALFCKKNPWGFVPGEAACASLMLPASAGVQPRAIVTGFAEAQEPAPAHLGTDSAFTGMSEAALLALDRHGRAGHPAPAQLLTDWNNSRYRAAEFSYAMVRLSGLLGATAAEASHPTHQFGQCGAGWLAAVLGTQSTGSALVLSGNEADGTRGAFVIAFAGHPVPLE